ncbi:hypothetical protein [Longitalea luteola]|uniref:hypothetical protein n=1 Tax=Longitalea luteola TaxID=2812563 RepID=UPI001A95B801|nr:hypothetical protein [Longitalea luteola]
MAFLFLCIMAKDKRYETIRKLIITSQLTGFMQMFDIVPKTKMAQDLGMHHQTFKKLLKDPERFTYKQTFAVASLVDVEAKYIVDIIYAQCIENKNKKRKK